MTASLEPLSGYYLVLEGEIDAARGCARLTHADPLGATTTSATLIVRDPVPCRRRKPGPTRSASDSRENRHSGQQGRARPGDVSGQHKTEPPWRGDGGDPKVQSRHSHQTHVRVARQGRRS